MTDKTIRPLALALLAQVLLGLTLLFWAAQGFPLPSSMTGDGEMIMRMALAHRITNSMCNGVDADRAAEEAIAAMERRVGGEAGCIVIDRHGQIGQAHNTSHMPTGWGTSEMPAAAASIKKER